MFAFKLDSELKQFIGFELNKEMYCINITDVQEIIMVPPITFLPNSERYIEGVINLRGKVVQIINLGVWLDIKKSKITPESRILIIEISGKNVGFLVDRIVDVIKAEEMEMHSLPILISQNLQEDYVRNIMSMNGEIYLEIDPRKIVTIAEEMIAQ